MIPDTAPAMEKPNSSILSSGQIKAPSPVKSLPRKRLLPTLRSVINVETSKSYPPLSQRKYKVKHLETKLEVDWARQFHSLGNPQKEVLLQLIDKNASLRNRVHLEPGICEKIEDELFEDSCVSTDDIKSEGAAGKVSMFTISIAGPDDASYASIHENLKAPSEESQDIFLIDYPIQDYKVVGGIPADQGSLENIWSSKYNNDEQGRSLKQLYGKFIENNIIKQSTNNDLELEAIAAMKMVSADLQSWVVNVLDAAVLMDPAIIQQVCEMDEKAGVDPQKQKGPPIPEIDISGFNVLLNACKPAILEARPPMKLNVVKEAGRMEAIPHNLSEKSKSKKSHSQEIPKKNRSQYGAWYLPIKQWTVKKESKGDDQYTKRGGHVFGGIVQQKLDDITKKRETDMKALMKENGELGENAKARKKRNKI